VSDAARQLRQADEFVRRMTAAVRANQLYAPSHPLAGRALKALAESAGQLLAEDNSVAVGFIDNEVVVGDIPLVQVGDAFAELLRRVRQVGIERIAFDRGVTADELGLLVETLARPVRAGVTATGQAADPLAVLGDLKRIRVGRLTLEERVEASTADVATIRRLYTDGVSIAGALWEMTQREGIPDPKQAKALVDSLAPVVAFEHHLRLDGTGYPMGVKRASLNLGTMLCSISDVYDAMRSQRAYQQAFPTDRILAVLQRSDGKQFDQHLVRRFVQLLGIYPPGNLVKLSSGEVAVVLKVHAPDPYRPRVRVLFDESGTRADVPYERNLFESMAHGLPPPTVVAPLDPAAYGVDPLNFMV
jgi:hypothetical protein